ncbi:MAG: hypothetical protein M1834_007152 [Cirrosporium novae-zelandiae]|nr:MAG: hypothetical protein M1834_007152 [Cirrosporium novae-zelandiae]
MANLSHRSKTSSLDKSEHSSVSQNTTPPTEKPLESSQSSQNQTPSLEPTQIKRATRTRRIFSLLSSFFFLVTVVFLILVLVGSTHKHPILEKIYFLKIDLSNIVPLSVPNAVLINSIAQTIGLHDFYQVGLWNFCEGYNSDGVTNCGTPKTMYWFDPVTIILNELLAGASIALPSNVTAALGLVRIASHWMFGFFIVGTVLSFVAIFLTPLSVYTRWASLPIAILCFLAALTTTVAVIIATVMFVIFCNVFETASGIASFNVKPSLGTEMFAFMWIAAGFSIVAWLVQTSMCCCCASRRDVRTGRKRGSSKAYSGGIAGDVDMVAAGEKRRNIRKRWGWGQRKTFET